MSLILAQSFMKQLKRLPAREQGLVSTQVLDLQADPTAARHSLHRVDGNAGWWSAYVNGDLRIILRREEDGTMVLCWTDHHDAAYLWARRHQLTRHPVTGSMQLVEMPEVRAQPQSVGTAPAPEPTRPRRRPCEALQITREDLLRLGVPEIWIDPVLQAEDEDALLDIGEHHLPPLAAEAVLKIAVGERPEVPDEDETPVFDAWNPEDWWVLSEDDDLKAALDNENWDAWCVYLHPSQRAIARKIYNGPYRVCGSAGTGKTVVALHHAKYILEQQPGARVLIVTFSGNLAEDLRRRCVPLLPPRLLERCEVRTLEAFAQEMYDKVFPRHAPVIDSGALHDMALDTLFANQERLPRGISYKFVLSEFERIIEPRRIGDADAYLRTRRRGVHVRLAAERRRQIWDVVQTVYDDLAGQGGLVTQGRMCQELAAHLSEHADAPRYFTDIIVDECQDLCEVELDLLMAYLAGSGRIFFAGDIGQRIVRYSFPWKPHGVDLRGRSRVLKVNYRTTHEIRSTADRLMDPDAADADDIAENRRGTVSLLSGPRPEFRQFATPEEEVEGVAQWLNHLHDDLHIQPDAVAIFYRSDAEAARARRAIEKSRYATLFMQPRTLKMLAAKGLEYKAVAVMACDNGVIPSPDRLAEADLVVGLEEIYDTERNLLYVACTRARNYLLITCGGVPSEFILDMKR